MSIHLVCLKDDLHFVEEEELSKRDKTFGMFLAITTFVVEGVRWAHKDGKLKCDMEPACGNCSVCHLVSCLHTYDLHILRLKSNPR